MHVVFRESHGLEETETPTDLGQSPADLVVLSFSDSDLGAFAAGWHRGGGPEGRIPSLRLANLAALKHPLSVDTYVEQTLEGARGILIRLIGGVPYWAYGLQQVLSLARAKGLALAVLPADGREDTRLDDYSTLPVSTLRRLAHLCDTGGEVAAQAALAQMALATGLYAGPVMGSKVLPECGAWCPDRGVIPADTAFDGDRPRVLVSFYRAYLTAADTAPIAALIRAFRARGFDAMGLFAPSLKAPASAKWLAEQTVALNPAAIVNATAFSGKGDSGASPLDAAGVPVFQAMLATSNRKGWDEAERGLSPADLAMHVVLPEVDGRITGSVISFKEPGTRDEHLQFARALHTPEPDRIRALVDRVSGWVRLASKPEPEQVSVLVLSTYPGKDWQMAHAVGLDALASAEAMLADLQEDGYAAQPGAPLTEDLQNTAIPWPLEDYRQSLATLPPQLRQNLQDVWGDPEEDPAFSQGAFHFAATRRGTAVIALQPERGTPALRDDEYHDLGRTPRHAYVAFYLWLRHALGADALIHIGAHGTLEWLPGKSVALSGACWPEALIGDLPVIYPFIVNDPGEAAQAKRRIGAVTLGHIPPALRESGTPDRMVRLEALLDEFSNADGLDPKRRDRLQSDIRDEAQAIGLEDDLGLDRASSTAEAITRIDRFVCDIKESQFGNGLHIFGRVPEVQGNFDAATSAHAERASLIRALAGKRIEAGPSGSPYRGRSDVLPTGRNLYTTDPRSVPTRAAYAQGVKLAKNWCAAFAGGRRLSQGSDRRSLGLCHHAHGGRGIRHGAAPAGRETGLGCRVGTGFGHRSAADHRSGPPTSGRDAEGLGPVPRCLPHPLGALWAGDPCPLCPRRSGGLGTPMPGRNRRPAYSGLPRAAMVWACSICPKPTPTRRASRPGMPGWRPALLRWKANTSPKTPTASPNAWPTPTALCTCRIWPRPICCWPMTTPRTRRDLRRPKRSRADRRSFIIWTTPIRTHRAREPCPRKSAALFTPAPLTRAGLRGMQRHGFRGAAEIAATLDHMASFAHLSGTVAPHLFDLYHDATLGDPEIDRFLQEASPQAHKAMQDRFRALYEAGLWDTRRNSIRAGMEGLL